MPTRAVTERDFRCPEFRDANPEDYEFRADGKIVRKDRWEDGIRKIVSSLGMSVRNFEIDDVVVAVDRLVAKHHEARKGGIEWAITQVKDVSPKAARLLREKVADGEHHE